MIAENFIDFYIFSQKILKFCLLRLMLLLSHDSPIVFFKVDIFLSVNSGVDVEEFEFFLPVSMILMSLIFNDIVKTGFCPMLLVVLLLSPCYFPQSLRLLSELRLYEGLSNLRFFIVSNHNFDYRVFQQALIELIFYSRKAIADAIICLLLFFYFVVKVFVTTIWRLNHFKSGVFIRSPNFN